MPTYDEIKDFTLSTDTNTNKNLSSNTFPFTSSSLNVAAGTYTQRSYVIPLSRATRLYQLYIEAPGIWTGFRALPMRDVIYDQGGANQRSISVNAASNGDSITLNFWFSNQSGSVQNFPAFSINVLRNDFIDEI